MLQAFEEQEDLSAANTPNRPHSHRPNPEPACLQVDQEPDQSAPQALRDASPFRTQWQKETNFIPIILGKQLQEKTAGEVREAEDMGGSSEPKQAACRTTYFANIPKSLLNTRISTYCGVSRVAFPRLSQTYKDRE
jgi:hypothetical protein